MNTEQLFNQIQQKRSFLCIGLDTDIQKIPRNLLDTSDPVFAFNKEIIDRTHDLAVAYKLNLAFYESLGAQGLISLDKTVKYIREKCPEMFIIADAKRGDIGNTSNLYARTFFDFFDFDALTVAPYMGQDSVTPFLAYPGKWVILLGLTSNQGADDFQFSGNPPLHQQVIKKAQEWANPDELMFVAGATRATRLKEIRQYAPDNFLLVPGVGAQGGSLKEVARHGMNSECGLLVNSSRGIIYADNSLEFAQAAAIEAKKMQNEMDKLLSEYL